MCNFVIIFKKSFERLPELFKNTKSKQFVAFYIKKSQQKTISFCSIVIDHLISRFASEKIILEEMKKILFLYKLIFCSLYIQTLILSINLINTKREIFIYPLFNNL